MINMNEEEEEFLISPRPSPKHKSDGQESPILIPKNTPIISQIMNKTKIKRGSIQDRNTDLLAGLLLIQVEDKNIESVQLQRKKRPQKKIQNINDRPGGQFGFNK
eukprot:UN34058